jgi:hypothetical protein
MSETITKPVLKLTEEQIQLFKKQGFFQPERISTRDEVEFLKGA